MINIEKLSKSYGNKLILEDVNLQLERGKIYGIIGENGAGKTTLFKCIAGLEKHAGKIYCKEGILKNQLGLLSTTPYFFAKMTGREYLQLLCTARKINIKDFDTKNIFDLPLDQYATNYSTGMKKKLALTAILLQKNDFFIFDEPFNGVDIQSNLLINSIIKQLRTLNKIIVISSHIFSSLKEICDHVFLLKNRKLQQSAFEVLEAELMDIDVEKKLKKLGW